MQHIEKTWKTGRPIDFPIEEYVGNDGHTYFVFPSEHEADEYAEEFGLTTSRYCFGGFHNAIRKEKRGATMQNFVWFKEPISDTEG